MDQLFTSVYEYSFVGIAGVLVTLATVVFAMFSRARLFGSLNRTRPLSKPIPVAQPAGSFNRVRNYSREAYESIIQTMPVKIDTQIYKDLHERWPKLYPKSVQETEIDLSVEYVDTALEKSVAGGNSTSERIILALGGNPGYFTHFVEQINHFRAKDNVRIISPDWPKFEHTRASKGIYWHSIPERLLFVKAFLRQLNIDRIDCLVGHSFAIQTIGAFWDNPEEFKIRSIMLLAPQPNWTLDIENGRRNTMKFALLFRHELWYSLLEKIRFTNTLNRVSPIKFRDTNELLTAATHILDDQSPEDLKQRLKSLTDESDINLKVIFGGNDGLILKKASDQLNEIIGVSNPQDIIHIHPQKVSLEEFKPSEERIASYVMHGSGHFAHAKFATYYNKMIEHLLERT